MMTEQTDLRLENIPRWLLLSAGILLIVCALIYNEFLLALFDPNPPLELVKRHAIRASQLAFSLIGLGLILASVGAQRSKPIKALLAKPSAANLLLAVLAFCLPLIILEGTLRPLAGPRTTIFMRDEVLGWKFRPGAQDEWGGVVVKINQKGLVGPELNYTKPEGVRRILFLGDSVTFGYQLEDPNLSFPFQVAPYLTPAIGGQVEVINAGVGGYSPWQEMIYLSQEGINYDPDLVVIGFVLNDVTEKFSLLRYGGSGEGYQLRHTTTATTGWGKFWDSSGILYFARQLAGKIRFGSDTQAGAIQAEQLNVEALAYSPERQDVETAWQITLENLEKIIAYCRARDIPVIMVIFPFTFQFEDPQALSAPQQEASQFALQQEIPYLDLLPVFSAEMGSQGLTPRDIFMDADHLTARGHQIVAARLADFIQSQGLIVAGR